MTIARALRFAARLLVLNVLGAAASCTTPHGEPHAHVQRSAIQGGMDETASTFAVAILTTDETCSGTLIAPNLVLTARHCIADDTGGAFVVCATDAFLAPKAASTFRVSQAAAAKTFLDAPYAVAQVLVPNDAAFCGNDIALLVLDQNIAAGTTTLATPILEKLGAKAHGPTITAIGYGVTAPGASDDGARRRRDGVPITCIPDDPTGPCDPADFDMTRTELVAGDGLCEGDSGSGAYVTASVTTGAPAVIGVLSRASTDAATCTDAIYTRTDAFADLLVASATQAAKAGGYPLPAWAGASDAGTSLPDPDAGAVPDDAETSRVPALSPAPAANDGCATSRGRPGNSGAILVLIVGLAVATARSRARRR